MSDIVKEIARLRKVLKAYINHVGNMEGVTFLDTRPDGLDDDEYALLKQLEKESLDDLQPGETI